ncbi:transglycosylase SLT domain-containing protein [Sandaracinobacteroides sp. A072]|uniref:transglycosylase SLT domain-containing protein n=1 Tax=Sandaracinobacteroides sp. A072 TaxID=3461146 RepID=UPI00404310DD
MTAQHRLMAALPLPILVLATLVAPLPALQPAAAQQAAAPAARPDGTTAAFDPVSRAWLARQFSLYAAGGSAAPAGAPDALADSLARWEWLRRPARAGQEPPLAAQAAFITAHADWPGVSAMRRRAEAQAVKPETPDADARVYFRALPPQTAAGEARLAMLSTGAEAVRLARAAWVRPGIPPELEAQLLARFGPEFTRADHARRADQLIWSGQTTAAGRLLSLLDDEARALTLARIALRTGAADAEARVASVPARYRRDAGLTFDRALWLERRNRLSEAEALLARGDIEPGVSRPEAWLEKRLTMGRAAMRRGDDQTAWRLLANHRAYPAGTELSALSLSERIDLSDTEWLAGWIALRRIGRAGDAVRHFTTFNQAVTTPISQSRGDYWLGRAEKARGNGAAANAAFKRAAAQFDYFYGQLAAEELGGTPALPRVTPPAISQAERARFEATPLARALLMLNAMEDRQRESLFVRALASSAATPVETRIAAELGQRIGRLDLGVWAWKSARPSGDFGSFDLAYPRLPASASVPAEQWIIAHAIARQESSFDRTALSHAGARGLMQLMPATAQDVARRLGLPYDVQRLFDDPAYNISLGSYYIGLRRDNFGTAAQAIAAYNGGAGNVRKWLAANGDPAGLDDIIDWVELIPFSETRTYVHRVVENAVVYSLLEPKRAGARPHASSWLKNK